ncbi:MAG TPA: HAD hydrolase-like protein [Bryobacteraceae bacterium]|nr:HAD hydrolase-like protein [Bryobacteraceae bacterium]
MIKPLLIFDMDGVLVDVAESYRETIACTAEHFTGVKITREQIQEYKNQGGWNDDWQLTHHIVTGAGVDVPFEEVRARFQRLFLGNGTDGLILRERWVANPGALEKLAEQFHLAIFTGRPREEAALTLNRFAQSLKFDPIIAMEDVENHKPAPDGLVRIMESALSPAPGHGLPAPAFYVGDTVDDARCARAAKVPFIGIAAPDNPLYIDLVFLFQAEGAYAIVDNINYLDEVFAS